MAPSDGENRPATSAKRFPKCPQTRPLSSTGLGGGLSIKMLIINGLELLAPWKQPPRLWTGNCLPKAWMILRIRVLLLD